MGIKMVQISECSVASMGYSRSRLFQSVPCQRLVRIASMLQQEMTFPISIVQQSMQITSMLQQETNFTIGIVQQSLRITLLLLQTVRHCNRDSATINAKYFNVTAGSSFYNPYSTISADNFNVTADYFYNYGVIVAGDARYFGSIFIENVNNLPIVPYGASSTDAIQSSSGIDIINIARPDSNGLSNNRYSDFNVLSSGLVF